MVLEATESADARGMGIFMHDDPADNEWYIGRPYASNDRFVINRKTGVTGHDESTADDSVNNLLTILSSGNLGVGVPSPSDKLEVAGNIHASAGFRDTSGDLGNNGQILSSTGTGTNWVSNSSNPIPFITDSTPDPVAPGQTGVVTISGYNFTPTSAVSVSGGNTINSVNVISPIEIEVNMNSSTTVGSYDFVISNNGVLNTEWAGNGVGIFNVVSDGTSQEMAGQSCKELIDNGHSTGDGTYWINPDGGDTSNAFQVYCDMTTDGGGWTKIAYSSDFAHENHNNAGPDSSDTSEWWNGTFQLTLTDTQINNIRAVSTEGKQTYVGTCDGVIHYEYNGGYGYAFGFRYHNGHETAYEQQTYPSTNITVTQDGCETNNNSSIDTIFEINDIRVPVIDVHSRDNGATSELFGSPLTNNPAWLR